MVTHSYETNTKYAVGYVGSPAGTNAILDSLISDGPLLIAQDHIVANMLPEALDTVAHAPKIVVANQDLQVALTPGFLFDADMRDCGTHWALGKTRWAKFFHDMNEAGLDTTPIKGEMEKAYATFSSRAVSTLIKLDAEKRTVKLADVMFYDDEAEDPDTDTFFDYVSMNMLLSGDGGHSSSAKGFSKTCVCWILTSSQGRPLLSRYKAPIFFRTSKPSATSPMTT